MNTYDQAFAKFRETHDNNYSMLMINAVQASFALTDDPVDLESIVKDSLATVKKMSEGNPVYQSYTAATTKSESIWAEGVSICLKALVGMGVLHALPNDQWQITDDSKIARELSKGRARALYAELFPGKPIPDEFAGIAMKEMASKPTGTVH